MHCSQSISEQRDLLESNNSRRIFDQVKDDSSSLCCLRDSASFQNSFTVTTERSSMLSKEFGFDAEIMTSKVYKGQIRSLVRRAMRKSRQATNEDSSEQGEGMRSALVNSAAIDKSLKSAKIAQQNEVEILLLGLDESEKCLFLHTMRMQYGESYSIEERQAANTLIQSFLHSAISMILLEIEASGRVFLIGDPLNAFKLSTWPTVENAIVPQDVAKSIHNLWKDPVFREFTQTIIDRKCLGSIT